LYARLRCAHAISRMCTSSAFGSRTCAQGSDLFRRKMCYTKAVSDVLDTHKESLGTIHERYAELTKGPDVLRDDLGMSIGEWLAFLQHVGLLEAGQARRAANEPP
jgi:hypothetical protein